MHKRITACLMMAIMVCSVFLNGCLFGKETFEDALTSRQEILAADTIWYELQYAHDNQSLVFAGEAKGNIWYTNVTSELNGVSRTYPRVLVGTANGVFSDLNTVLTGIEHDGVYPFSDKEDDMFIDKYVKLSDTPISLSAMIDNISRCLFPDFAALLAQNAAAQRGESVPNNTGFEYSKDASAFVRIYDEAARTGITEKLSALSEPCELLTPTLTNEQYAQFLDAMKLTDSLREKLDSSAPDTLGKTVHTAIIKDVSAILNCDSFVAGANEVIQVAADRNTTAYRHVIKNETTRFAITISSVVNSETFAKNVNVANTVPLPDFLDSVYKIIEYDRTRLIDRDDPMFGERIEDNAVIYIVSNDSYSGEIRYRFSGDEVADITASYLFKNKEWYEYIRSRCDAKDYAVSVDDGEEALAANGVIGLTYELTDSIIWKLHGIDTPEKLAAFLQENGVEW